jgi:hypothetical protein
LLLEQLSSTVRDGDVEVAGVMAFPPEFSTN